MKLAAGIDIASVVFSRDSIRVTLTLPRDAARAASHSVIGYGSTHVYPLVGVALGGPTLVLWTGDPLSVPDGWGLRSVSGEPDEMESAHDDALDIARAKLELWVGSAGSPSACPSRAVGSGPRLRCQCPHCDPAAHGKGPGHPCT